ncbi:MAG: SdiA-regulated domain-containing protein [Sandaracinaceae bacterium]|nr:SdiA-regulated domain-containing protein [Sandaracinaceae bacterium]
MTGWREIHVTELQVPQASGVTSLGRGRFLVVDDDRGVYVARADGSAELAASRDDHPKLRDLEGICLAPDGSAWVLSERTSAVLSLSVEDADGAIRLGEPRLVGEIEHIARKKNKGWEGLAIHGGARPWVLASHEARPRKVGIFTVEELATVALLSLPDELDDLLDDLSDLTSDPETGRIFLVSDESRVIAEVALRFEDDEPVGLELCEVIELDLGKKEKAEGVCFDEHGALWLVTDGDAHLRTFRQR